MGMQGMAPSRRRLIQGGLAFAAGGLLPGFARARIVTDMGGHEVKVPDTVGRIYVAHDPPAIFLSSLAPDLMVGFPFAR